MTKRFLTLRFDRPAAVTVLCCWIGALTALCWGVLLVCAGSAFGQESQTSDATAQDAAQQKHDVGKLTEKQVAAFAAGVLPVLESYCADCHLDGADEGGVTLDALVDPDSTARDKKLWDRALKQLRCDLMPPPDMDQPTAGEQAAVESWIKDAVFLIDPKNPEPGHVIVRRLNRIEYRNTIRDLFDYQVNTDILFPPDDAGHGFDNIAEVLTLSPLLMEKYINAATEVVMAKVPVVSVIPQQRWFNAKQYEVLEKVKPRPAFQTSKQDQKPSAEKAKSDDVAKPEQQAKQDADKGRDNAGVDNPIEPVDVDGSMLRFFYSGGGKAKLNFKIAQTGKYDLSVVLKTGEQYVEGAVDTNRCRAKIICDGEVVADEEFVRESWQDHPFIVSKQWPAGEHWLTVNVTPLTNEKQTRRLRLMISETRLTGPLGDRSSYVFPQRHGDYFPDAIPESNDGRRQYARRLLFKYAKKAFRRPPEPETVNRLVDLAESVWAADSPDATFEKGIAQSLIAILSSPNFIFRETFVAKGESPDVRLSGITGAPIDEYSLATRLSYFLWSTMPDDRMIELADAGKLRENLDAVVKKMVKDERFNAFYENFMGQWLRTRDIAGVTINAFAVLRNGKEGILEGELRQTINRLKSIREELTEPQRQQLKMAYQDLKKLHKRAKKFVLNADLRTSMRRETEMLFSHIVKTDSDLVQLIDCDFTFLNERLATHYNIKGVKGKKMRRVTLEPGSHRGGILTHGSFLAVSSNPDRTSPVKRGVFVLDNLLGMPPGSPPPDIPALEEAAGEDHTRLPLRQALAKHREDPMCSSCHDRMDPLGLALENFDALGRYRTKDADEDIDASGRLVSGESFKNIDDLKVILAKGHKAKFYRCITEKLMTYALGRSVEYYDLQTIDDIVDRLIKEGGKPSILLEGVIRSPAFQMTRLERDVNPQPVIQQTAN